MTGFMTHERGETCVTARCSQAAVQRAEAARLSRQNSMLSVTLGMFTWKPKRVTGN